MHHCVFTHLSDFAYEFVSRCLAILHSVVLISLKCNRGRNEVRKNRGKGAGGEGRGEVEGEKGKLEKWGKKRDWMRNKKMYVGVEVREIEEGAEDEKGQKQKNTTGTITGKEHVTEVWKKKGWVVDG